jgi:hypothetical protein
MAYVDERLRHVFVLSQQDRNMAPLPNIAAVQQR